jgi:hypothetical protein
VNGVVSDDLWALIEAVLPSGRRRGRPWNDPWFRLVAAPFAFARCVIALPASPFESISSAEWFKAFVLVFGAILISA